MLNFLPTTDNIILQAIRIWVDDYDDAILLHQIHIIWLASWAYMDGSTNAVSCALINNGDTHTKLHNMQ